MIRSFIRVARGSNNALRITMDRPALNNAFDEVFIRELTEAFDEVNSTHRSVILAAEGKSFSAGADLNWMKKMIAYTEEENYRDSLALFDMVQAIASCPVPVISRVNGHALGGGCGIVAASDVSIAMDRATFGLTEVKLGLIPAVISPFVMNKIGKANCSKYFLTGERFNAANAQSMGLVNTVVSSEEELDAQVNHIAEEINKNSPAAVRAAKQLISNVSTFPGTFEAREYVSSAISKIRVSPEGQEGLSAFLEKRSPKWISKTE